MKKQLIFFALFLFMGVVHADGFIHEGDHNYSIVNMGMTTAPFLNGYLIVEFNLRTEASLPAGNTHVHLTTFDDRNTMVQDYTVKQYSNDPVQNQTINNFAIGQSTGYDFYRTIDAEKGIAEHRLVSDDNGLVSAKLFLNPCGINETKNCYYQTGKYRLEIKQNNLTRNENFTIGAEEINTNFFFQSISTLENNAPAITIIIISVVIAFAIVVLAGKWVINRIRGNS